jgi:hypothetical protein
VGDSVAVAVTVGVDVGLGVWVGILVAVGETAVSVTKGGTGVGIGMGNCSWQAANNKLNKNQISIRYIQDLFIRRIIGASGQLFNHPGAQSYKQATSFKQTILYPEKPL